MRKDPRPVRKVLLYGGILAVLVGLVWMGQGSGYFPYPRESFMINEMPWLYRGLALAESARTKLRRMIEAMAAKEEGD